MRAVKNYKVDLQPGPKCRVIEQPTGLVVANTNDPREAKKFANILNGGNGFNGFTPSFFLHRWRVD